MLFHDLPLDIITSICCFIGPLDIIALGQTCSTLKLITHERHVWICALKRMCGQNWISTKTFTTGEMSLEELQHMSTAPSRMMSKICKGSLMNQNSESPAILPPFSFHAIHPDLPTLSFYRVYLIPGGRFLLAHDDAAVFLYDLNTARPVALRGQHLKANFAKDLLFTPCPHPIEGEIRVMMASGALSECSVIRFCFDDKENKFASVVVHRIPQGVVQMSVGEMPYTFVGDLVVFCGRTDDEFFSTVAVWNYIENALATWKVPNALYLEMYLERSHVVLVTFQSLFYWAIPPLKPIDLQYFQSPRLEHHTPHGAASMTAILKWPEVYPPDVVFDAQCTRLFDWYNTFDSLHSLCFLLDNKDSNHCIRFPTPRYDSLCSTTDVSSTTPTASLFPVPYWSVSCLPNVGKQKGSQPDNTLAFGPSSQCDGHIVQPIVEFENVFIHASKEAIVDDQHPLPSFDRIVELKLPAAEDGDELVLCTDLFSRMMFSFDPISGRLAYIAGKGNSSGSKIVVVDYLKYPGVINSNE